MNKSHALTFTELQEARAEFQAKLEEAANRQCTAYHSAFTGLVKCPCKPLRIITYQVLDGEPVSGDYCAKHAIELRRDEARGKLEILTDEPIAGPEIGMRGFYGV